MGLLSLVLAAAPAAFASSIPFDVEPHATPAIVQVNFCAWAASPQSTPYACNLPSITVQPMRVTDLGNIADRIQEIRYGLHWID